MPELIIITGKCKAKDLIETITRLWQYQLNKTAFFVSLGIGAIHDIGEINPN